MRVTTTFLQPVLQLVLIGCGVTSLDSTTGSSGVADAVTIDWVTVGTPGNACDPQSNSCYGAVSYEYRISKFEITNDQYAAFLDAVGSFRPHQPYQEIMRVPPPMAWGGIVRSRSSGGYRYKAIPGRENMPVNYVQFEDALRFANWLHNGQPTGRQDNSTTEDGAYTIIPIDPVQPSIGDPITRNPYATFFIPSADEWYKAAYYDPVSTNYFDYPAASDTPTPCTISDGTLNTANCGSVMGDLTDVGSFTESSSPVGTFDQGGNVTEWCDDVLFGVRLRSTWGEGFDGPGPNLPTAGNPVDSDPEEIDAGIGFRVASIP